MLKKPSYISTEACNLLQLLRDSVSAGMHWYDAKPLWHPYEIAQFLSTDTQTEPQLQACLVSAHEAMTAEVAAAASIKDASSDSREVCLRRIWLNLYILKWAFFSKVAMSL